MNVAPISVAVATVDRPEALDRCLEAILTGDTLPAQLIVVDQGGKAETAAVVATHRTVGVEVMHAVSEPRGLAASRNEARRNATSAILAVTDDDCVPHSAWVTVLASTFAGDDAPDAVTGRVLPLGAPRPGLFPASSRTSDVRRDFAGRASPWDVGTGANFAAKREWLDRVEGFDERLGAGTRGRAGEDMDVLHRLLRAGARIRFEPDAIVLHEQQDADSRRASRVGYGMGMGAACGVWLRQRDGMAPAILGRWMAMRGSLLAAALRRRRWQAMREELLVIGGTARGLAYGLRAGRRLE